MYVSFHLLLDITILCRLRADVSNFLWVERRDIYTTPLLIMFQYFAVSQECGNPPFLAIITWTRDNLLIRQIQWGFPLTDLNYDCVFRLSWSIATEILFKVRDTFRVCEEILYITIVYNYLLIVCWNCYRLDEDNTITCEKIVEGNKDIERQGNG